MRLDGLVCKGIANAYIHNIEPEVLLVSNACNENYYHYGGQLQVVLIIII